MADYLHQLAHNKAQRNRSRITPAWQRQMMEELNITYVPPAEASDDPWQPVVYPRNEDFGGF